MRGEDVTRRAFLGLLVAGSCWEGLSLAAGDEIAVVVNLQHPARRLSLTDLRPIFQTRKIRWPHGEDAVPLNLPDTDPLRTAFDEVVLGLDPDRVARYWKDRKIRGGSRAPAQAANTLAVLKFVALKRGAVGYVRANEVSSAVKVVARIGSGEVLAP